VAQPVLTDRAPAPALKVALLDRRRALAATIGSRALTAAAALCAAAPIIASTARGISAGWLPAGDQANIAVRAFDVFTSRTPLLGLHSDVSFVTHHDVYSLGPMLFWLLALPARFGSPATMALTMGLVAALSAAGCVVLARRRGGVPLMLLTAAALAVMTRSLAPEIFHDVWNPSAGELPFTLLVFLAWGVACGEHRLLPVTAVVASFVVQCQLAFVPPVAGVLAVALVGFLAGILRRGAKPARRAARWWALAAVVLTVACWTPTAIQQIEGSPGNLTRVVETVRARKTVLGSEVGWRAVVRTVGVAPWWLHVPASPWQRKQEVRTDAGSPPRASAIAVIALVVLVAGVGLLRRRRALLTGALIGLALCVGVYAVAASTPVQRTLAETLGYTLWWASPAGMFVWIVGAWGLVLCAFELAPLAREAAPRLREGGLRAGMRYRPRFAATRRQAGGEATGHESARPGRQPSRARAPGGQARARTVAGIVAAVAGLSVAAAAAAGASVSQKADNHLPEYRPLAAVYGGLDRGVPRGRTVRLLASLSSRTFRFKMAARFALVRRGIRPLSPGLDVRLGSWYSILNRPYDCTVYVDDGDRSPAHGARALARTTFADGTGRYPVSVWLAPAGCPRRTATGAPGALRGSSRARGKLRRVPAKAKPHTAPGG
jgi:hypothetical protein